MPRRSIVYRAAGRSNRGPPAPLISASPSASMAWRPRSLMKARKDGGGRAFSSSSRAFCWIRSFSRCASAFHESSPPGMMSFFSPASPFAPVPPAPPGAPPPGGGLPPLAAIVALLLHRHRVLQARLDEVPEERVGQDRLRLELGVELTPHEPGVIRDLHDLHQSAIGRESREREAVLLEHL